VDLVGLVVLLLAVLDVVIRVLLVYVVGLSLGL
jgi:hypothetical protein